MAEEYLYNHLVERVKLETPEELLARFQSLFIDGTGYSDHAVWQTLKAIVDSSTAEKEFKFILNRSCHILINHWLMQPRLHNTITDLVALFEQSPSGQGRSRTSQRLRELVQQFKLTEQYAALKRLVQVVHHPSDWSTGSKPLGTLIRRYPCLYDYNLLTEDSTREQRRCIRHMRREIQQQLEQDLARYITAKRRSSPLLAPAASLPMLHNPTLLSDRHLDQALQQFGGKIDGSNTYRDLAQCFLTYSSRTCSYRSFKADLYEYLVASIDTRYGKAQFNQRLSAYIQNLLPDQAGECLSDVLLVCTCRKLLNFLVIESAQKPNHGMFVDLTGNLGITTTIGLLLKIVLICRTVKPYLEKKFAVLFKHYEASASEGVVWLIESLENLNVALSLNFGKLSL
ncbi:hypothetical protein IFO70_11065 [Phormidium tenue FACHB-886]|nr:hypothetical protein [Phormidium tenue FACHB-886]